MKRILLLIALVVGLGGAAFGQGNSVTIEFPGAPSGGCAFVMYGINAATGDLYDCLGGSWHLVGPGAAGSAAFNTISSGTNTSAVMVVSTGASLSASGSGTITATAVPLAGISGLGTGVGTFLGTPSSANLAAAVTDETGTGALVFATSPTFVTPALGTPASGTLTNTTGLLLNNLADPGANKAFTMGTNTLNFNMTGNWGTGFGVSITSNGSNLATGPLFQLSTGATTTHDVFQACAQGTSNCLEVTSAGSITTLGTSTFNVAKLSGAINLAASGGGGVTGILPGANGGTGVNNTATLTLGSSNVNLATLGTGIMKNTTTTGAITDAAAADVYGLFTGCTGSSGGFLKDGGTCATPAGSGTVTVSGGGSLTNTAFMTGAGTTVSQTPSATSTLDTSGNASFAGTVTAGSTLSSTSDGTHAGGLALVGNTTVPTLPANSAVLVGPATATLTSYALQVPVGIPTNLHLLYCAVSGTTCTLTDTGYAYNAIPAADIASGQLGSGVQNSASLNLTGTVGSGTITVTGDAPTSGACSAEHTASVTGLLTTDVVRVGFNGDPTAVTGIAPSTSGGVYIVAYPKAAGTLGLKVCNDTSATITVGTLVLNYTIQR